MMRTESRRRVLVIGGGLAGLAAAAALADSSFDVTLIEARPQLGGRATSFTDATTQERIDNCQHVSMGCCTNLADFCERVGIADRLRVEPVLYFQDEHGRVSPMGVAPLPPPFHLAPGFLRARFLTLSDKLRIARGIWHLLREPTAREGESFRSWLLRHGQSESACERYWGLVLTSALNESLENVDYRYARQVFLEGFLANRRSPVVVIPSVPLGDFYGSALEDWFRKRTVDLRLNTAVLRLDVEAGGVQGAKLRDNQTLIADDYVLAVPFHRVADLLGEPVCSRLPELEGLGEIQVSPITSVHLWFDRPVMEHPHLVPVGRTVQWLFQRSDVSQRGETEHYVQAVISASRALESLRKEKVQSLVLEEVRQLLPLARNAKLSHARVVTERSATYSVRPGIDRLRPMAKTSVENLFLAGDYVQTGWPATMEGAVRSGYLAARAILERHGDHIPLLRPPLRRGLLVHLLAK